MSIYDLVMIVVFAGSILFGLWKGLAWQVASVAAVFLSYFVSVTFRGRVSGFISAEEPWNQFAAMLILFLGTSLIVWTVFAGVSQRIRKLELNGFDRQAGAVLGAIKGALLCMVVTMFAVALLGDSARNAIYESRTGGYIVRGINELPSIVPTEIHHYIDPYIQRFNQRIVDQNGNLPEVRPILGTSDGQPAPGGDFASQPAANQPATNQPGGGSLLGGLFGGRSNQPASTPSTPVAEPSTQYNPGPYSQNPNEVPTYQGSWQMPTRPAQMPTQPAQNAGYGAPPNRYPGQSPGYGPPATDPRYSPQVGYQSQPPAQPPQQPAANGWPDFDVRVNSKDLLDAAANATRRMLEDATQR